MYVNLKVQLQSSRHFGVQWQIDPQNCLAPFFGTNIRCKKLRCPRVVTGLWIKIFSFIAKLSMVIFYEFEELQKKSYWYNRLYDGKSCIRWTSSKESSLSNCSRVTFKTSCRNGKYFKTCKENTDFTSQTFTYSLSPSTKNEAIK